MNGRCKKSFIVCFFEVGTMRLTGSTRTAARKRGVCMQIVNIATCAHGVVWCISGIDLRKKVLRGLRCQQLV